MTVVAGYWSDHFLNDQHLVGAMLQDQQSYGQGAHDIRAVDGTMAMGRLANFRLPEDRFDRQPLLGAARFLLVADLRLDNRDELTDTLGLEAPTIHSLCDADLLLHAWMRWQEGALDRLVGDYAIAVFDRRERRLTLARDPTGQRPLFFARADNAIGFASMPSGLLACPHFRRGFRMEALAAMLIGRSGFGPETHFEGIERVCPGEKVYLYADRITRDHHWQPPVDWLALTDDDAVEGYREHLDLAVRAQRRRSAGLLGAHLSSGYDSSAVAATAALGQPSVPLIAFTAAPREGFNGPVPRGRMADESSLAALTAARHRMRHEIVRPTGGLFTHLRRHSLLYQEPDRNIVNMEWWSEANARASTLGVSTMLTGQLGNLTLNAGGLPILAEWVRLRRWRRWLHEAGSAAQAMDVRWRGILYASFERSIPVAARTALDRHYLQAASLAEQAFVRPDWLNCGVDQERERGKSLPYEARRREIYRNDSGVFRKGALAEHGIDERDPTSDRRLIEFSLRLPPEQFLRNGLSRPMARRALADRVPSEVLDAPLRGYQGADWHLRFDRAEAGGLIEEIATSRSANALLDIHKMKRALDSWPTAGAADPGTQSIYRTRLLIALSTGMFIQALSSLAGA
ncbi:asparagine synthase-related protein [Sphingomonas sp.]|uniref:asparagine synthetase B family protein n=1 Tax=Sphingomonas sp. TaxID=28214 RepID=UPI00286B4724|nr:asparagine synthase-related protein [Sphingomonas sp.]